MRPALRQVVMGRRLASLYLGQVATKSRIPCNRSTTNKQANARTHHVARDNITSLKIELPNWYWTRGGTLTEAAGGGNITYSASVEYPAGTFTQILFAGAATAVCASNTSLLSDFCAVNIPNGASFWIRSYANAVTAIVFTDGNAGFPQLDYGNGEAYEYSAASTTDKTMGGTLTDNGAATAPICVPTAIIANTRKPSVLILGDSRDWGFTDLYDASGDLGDLARSIGPAYGYINAGCAGDTLSGFITAHTRRAALQTYCSHVIFGDPINALRAGGSGQNKSAATVLGELQTILGYFPTKRCFTTTPGGPNTTGAWTAVDGSDQTVNANQAEIANYTTAIRAGVANSVGSFDIMAAVENPTAPGKWWATGVAQATTSDGLHSVQLSYLRIKNSGAIDPARIHRDGL